MDETAQPLVGHDTDRQTLDEGFWTGTDGEEFDPSQGGTDEPLGRPACGPHPRSLSVRES